MKQSFYLMIFAFCAALHHAQGQDGLPPPPPPPQQPYSVSYDYLRPLSRVARQMPPPPPPPEMPEMPPMPPMPQIENSNRMKRSAKGVGGSMPTRKG